MLRLATEFGAQFRTLGSDPRRASIEVTLPCHVTSNGYQGSGSKRELFCSEESRDHNITRGAQSAINPKPNSAAKSVSHQCLLRFSQAELPGRSRMLDAAERRGACSSGVSGDHDVIGIRF